MKYACLHRVIMILREFKTEKPDKSSRAESLPDTTPIWLKVPFLYTLVSPLLSRFIKSQANLRIRHIPHSFVPHEDGD